MTTRPRAHGAFCWSDLATSDLAGARRFYGSLFGWQYQDMTMDDGSVYVIAALPSGDVCGLYAQMPEQTQAGERPCWTSYVTVDSVDATVTAAVAAGGALIFGPMDIPDTGRMATLADPQGAVFAIWQGDSAYAGAAEVGPLPGTVCWHELATTDLDAAERFYQPLFGWGMRIETATGAEYIEWLVDHQPVGGALAIGADWGDVPPHWLSYIAVADCDAAVTAAATAGGTILKAPFDIPQVGRSAVMLDPAGAAFAVIALTAAS
jgi:hypothetical protein